MMNLNSKLVGLCLGHFLDVPVTILLCNLFKISCQLSISHITYSLASILCWPDVHIFLDQCYLQRP